MTRSKPEVLAHIRAVGLIPIIRTPSTEDAWQVAQVILGTGVGIVEITMGVPNGLGVIERIAKHYGDKALLGAGTVLDPDACRAAIAAGAAFIVAPNLDRQVLAAAQYAGAVCIPGALTPTEVLTAHQAGADMVKIFPCGPVGGPRYIRALRGPFPDIELVPTGGITLEAVPEFITAGVAALGIGGEIVDAAALRAGNLERIGVNAREFLAAVRQARTALESSRCESKAR
jgi:2-dehydro-3-deoxyphosphogluconate aldolase/(4S)-4-hydroxy-2-oxoglutarate aldolase